MAPRSPIFGGSIRTKLSLVFSVVVGLIALFIFSYFPERLAQQNYQALRDKTESIASLAAFSVSAALVFGDSTAASEVLANACQDSTIVYLVVLDTSGHVFAAHNLVEAERRAFRIGERSGSLPGNPELLANVTPVVRKGQLIGHLYIGMSLARLTAHIRASRVAILIVSILVFLVGVATIHTLSFFVVRPLSQMVETVGLIANGDLTRRAEVSSRDEVGHLAAAFNEMVEKLAVVHRQLENANQDLETRVKERTSQLAASEEALRHTSEQVHALSGHLQTVREEERAYISREIHDELGQALTAMNIDLAVMEKQLRKIRASEAVSGLITKVHYLSAMVESTIQSMHRLALELRPDVLDKLGLVEALEWQVKEFQTRTSIRCDVHVQAKPIALDEPRAIALFRMLQESLTNILRHARATKIGIRLQEQNGHVILEIRDNGKGIKEGDLLGIRSLGIIGMRERAGHFGGDVRFEGIAGQGTTVTIDIPLA